MNNSDLGRALQLTKLKPQQYPERGQEANTIPPGSVKACPEVEIQGVYITLHPSRVTKSWLLALISRVLLHLREIWVRCVATTNTCSLNRKMRHTLKHLGLCLDGGQVCGKVGLRSRPVTRDSRQAPSSSTWPMAWQPPRKICDH